MRRYVLWFMLLALIVASIFITPKPSGAQDNITLSLAVPNFQSDIFGEQLFADFETAHPGVKVKVTPNSGSIPSPTGGLDARFTALQQYVQSADVLFIDSRRIAIMPEDTQAGFFLDLAPLVNQDQSINSDDFYPTIWQAFQWDRGIWGLPTSADAYILSYDPAAFDKANLAYPNEKWTMDDLVSAVDKLTIKDASGAVVTPGLGVAPADADTALFRSLLGQGLFDASTVPNTPQIDTPAIESLLNAWEQLVQNQEVGSSFTDSPISIGAVSTYVRSLRTTSTPRAAVMLPGGKAGLTVQGLAVSAGTQYPQQAYELANYLTTRAELVNRFSVMPARKSLVGVQSAGGGNGGRGGNGGGGPGGPGGGIRNGITPETQAVIDSAITNGLATSELRYSDYLLVALDTMKSQSVDAKTALQTVVTQVSQNQTTAVNKKQGNTLAVATPVPIAALPAGKIELKFSMSSPVSPLPNQDKWDKLIADFVASDPQVGRVTMDTAPRFGQNSALTNTYDCFYLPYNAVPSTDISTLLNLDPFLAADQTFDKSDVMGNALDQVTRDNKIYGLPIVIEPAILQYDSTQFDKAHIPQPTAGWSVDQFKDAVKSLKPDPSDPAPFVGSNTNGSALLLLMAAYGGLPLDYRTNPPTINFTDPATVDAIRQVLDLAKQGYIKYDALGGNTFGNFGNDQTAPIYSETLNGFTFRRNVNNSTTASNDVFKPTTYPSGTKMSAITYNISVAYISAKSQNPDACYRWISALAHHPDLFSAMPARRSLINDPQVAASQGPDNTALYNQVDKMLQDPNTVSLPSLARGGSPAGFIIQHWLFQAFDSYVLQDADLDAALKQADTYAKAFQDCTSKIPPFDPNTQNQRSYNQQFTACATNADPSLKGLFGGGGGGQP